MMYQAQEMLAAIDQNSVPILIGFGIAMVLQTIWLVDAILVARREKLYSIPLFCTFFWFAHDLGCAIRFDLWFNHYDHWFMKFFWLGLFSAVFMELIFLMQIIKYGRNELAPNMTSRAFTLLIAGTTVSGVIVWQYLKIVMNDPLYLASPSVTMFFYALFGAALYLRRGSSAGQSPLMWCSFTTFTLVWWGTTILYFPPGYSAWPHVAIGVISFAVGCVMSYLALIDRQSSRTPVVVSL